MMARLAPLLALACLGLAACSALDNREWMKTEQRYTKAEFQRDYKECSPKGDLDESCMRQRGWVPVNPTKQEAPRSLDPLQGKTRGRY
jgi:hypothetical protein